MDENTLIAFEMNGEPLPHWNGFPARLVVPGWTGTYWVKQLVIGQRRVVARNQLLDEDRVPAAAREFSRRPRFKSQLAEANEPITDDGDEFADHLAAFGQQIARGKPVEVKGVAWDGGSGIARVEVSTNGGDTWTRRSSAATTAASRSASSRSTCRPRRPARWSSWRARPAARAKRRPSSLDPQSRRLSPQRDAATLRRNRLRRPPRCAP